MVVEVFVAERYPVQPLFDARSHRVLDQLRIPTIDEAPAKRFRMWVRSSTSRKRTQPPSELILSLIHISEPTRPY